MKKIFKTTMCVTSAIFLSLGIILTSPKESYAADLKQSATYMKGAKEDLKVSLKNMVKDNFSRATPKLPKSNNKLKNAIISSGKNAVKTEVNKATKNTKNGLYKGIVKPIVDARNKLEKAFVEPIEKSKFKI